MEKLYDRKIVKDVFKYIDSKKIVVIHGSRQVGKTTIMKLLMNKLEKNIPKENIVYFDLEDFVLLDLFNRGAGEVFDYLNGLKFNKNFSRYMFVDEIQYLDNPSGFLKLFNDRYKEQIQMVVSGSSSFRIKSKFKDSLVGRTVDFEVFGLDFEEYLEFKELPFNLRHIRSDIMHKEISQHFSDYIIHSAYPGVVLEKNLEKKEKYLKQIISTYIKKDIKDIAHIKNITKFNNLLRILSERSCNLLNILELSNILGITRGTVQEYLLILENTYIIKLLTPFFRKIKTELVKMPKNFFEDTGIMILLNYLGFIKKINSQILENAFYTMLRKKNPVENIHYWRTLSGQEIDFVVEKGKTNFLAFEIKLNYTGQSLNNLRTFTEKYKKVSSYIITLQKAKESKNNNVKVIYPWEIYNLPE